MSDVKAEPASKLADVRPGLNLPARFIPVPTSVSPQAQAIMSAASGHSEPFPTSGNSGEWHEHIDKMNAALLPMMRAANANAKVDVEERRVGETKVFVIAPQERTFEERYVWLDLHGGGLVMGGGELCKYFGIRTAATYGLKVWAVDYRMPPDHPYPAALDDGLAAYKELLKRHKPEEIVIGGGSAGGNLTAALILRARDEGLPLPAAAVLTTPELDLTESGDSFQTNFGLDSVLTRSLVPANLLYAAGHDLAHPYLSPLFGDFSLGFPPTFINAGTRDLFLSNAVRMHWALLAQDVPAELYLTEAGSHGGFQGCPEEIEMQRQIKRFLTNLLGRKA